MQRLLREGEQDLGFRDGCVPVPACPKVIFLQPRFPSDLALPRVGAAARAAGGMPEYGEYPQDPSRRLFPNPKKKTGYPLGRKGGYGMGTGYAVSG